MNEPMGGAQHHVETMRARLWSSISQRRLLIAPGVYDGLSARVAAGAGFGVLYVSGGAVARSTGVPDVGLMTMSEVLDRTRQIVDAVDCPVIADADTGYGHLERPAHGT